jgi:hypothetical protein
MKTAGGNTPVATVFIHRRLEASLKFRRIKAFSTKSRNASAAIDQWAPTMRGLRRAARKSTEVFKANDPAAAKATSPTCGLMLDSLCRIGLAAAPKMVIAAQSVDLTAGRCLQISAPGHSV